MHSAGEERKGTEKVKRKKDQEVRTKTGWGLRRLISGQRQGQDTLVKMRRGGHGEALALRASTHGRVVVYQARVS